MRFLKKITVRIFSALGFELQRKSKNDELNKRSFRNNNKLEKNSLLSHFYKILKDQNFYPTVIYDIGANRGTWTKECLKFFPNTEYYLFEPQMHLKEEIHQNLEGFDNFQVFSIGLGKEDGESKFTIHDREDSCSFSFSEIDAERRGFKQISIPINSLNSFISKNKIKKPNLIKIDAEGFDLEVLKGADKILDKVEVILVEVGVMNKRLENSVINVINFLDELGFIFFDVTDLNRPFSNEVLWLCEFVFVRKNGMLDKNFLEN